MVFKEAISFFVLLLVMTQLMDILGITSDVLRVLYTFTGAVVMYLLLDWVLGKFMVFKSVLVFVLILGLMFQKEFELRMTPSMLSFTTIWAGTFIIYKVLDMILSKFKASPEPDYNAPPTPWEMAEPMIPDSIQEEPSGDVETPGKPWGIKGEDGQYVTEAKLFNAMKSLGLNPKSQYKISRMTVDFAFPEQKLAIEVNGRHHKEPEQARRDTNRLITLKHFGWKVETFEADEVYDHADLVASRIKRLLHSHR